jgi:intein/homing endonuclease
MGLGDISKIKRKNPLLKRTQFDIENPGLHEMRLMRDKNYLAFAAATLLDVQLLPEQSVILEELWIRPFPMYVASRGFGKSFLLALYALLKCALYPGTKIVIVGAGFRQAKIIFEYMEQLWRNAPILRSICDSNSGPSRDVDRCTMRVNDSWAIAIPIGDGCLCGSTMITTNSGFDNLKNKPEYIWSNNKFRKTSAFNDNGQKATKIITTKKGFSFEGTHNHKMKVCRDRKIQWVRTDDMKVGDRILIDRSNRWSYYNNFKCSIDEAYYLGIMIGDGCWTQKYRLTFATHDHKEFYSALQKINPRWYLTGDEEHYNLDGINDVETFINYWKLTPKCYTKNKYLPLTILSAEQKQVTACLQGLFDTDGSLQVTTTKGGTAIGISFCNTSEKLVKQIQYILLHYGIISCFSSRQRKENLNWNRVYELLLTGQNAVLFGQKIGFRLERKNTILQNAIKDKIRTTEIDNTIPNVKDEMIRVAKQYKGKRVDSLALSKIKSRKEITFEYALQFLEKYKEIDDNFIEELSELLNPDIYYDTIINIKDGECDTYDIEVPETHEYCANGFFSHNSKIRGLRAHIILADEFAAISPEIYETVISGFTAVSADPISNVKEAARRRELTKLGIWTADAEFKYGKRQRNQSIVSGTADYAFKPFAKYWKRYKAIIESKGNIEVLKNLLEIEELSSNFNWTDYSIIRIPYELIPEGFMDDKQIIRAKSTIHSGIYAMEYGAVFVADSEGFFKRSLIESCVTSPEHPIILDGFPIWFDPLLHGSKTREYVIGIDPASEQDNFSIVVLELHNNHVRLVYGWSTNRKDFQRRLKSGLAKKDDFYGFCARKIRDLMKVFPTKFIAMDGQGGGVAVEEALHDTDKMEQGELPIWPIIEDKVEKESDVKPGLHILHVCQFARGDWTSEANHGLRKDLEDKVLLFPRFDSLALGIAAETDNMRKKAFETEHPERKFDIYDTLEDCVMEIEELKTELSTIVMTTTSAGVGARDKWDTPEIKLPNGKKGKLRKDRYSALVMANMIARQYKRADILPEYKMIGDFATNLINSKEDGPLYSGPDWFVQGMNDILNF